MYTLFRTYHIEATTGILVDYLGNTLCSTLELPWLDNKHNISCVPEGTYNVIRYLSPEKGDVWMIQNVEDRKYIEIHSANYVNQLLGCIAVGAAIQENISYAGVIHRYWITDSRATLKKLKSSLLPSNFVLEIRKG